MSRLLFSTLAVLLAPLAAAAQTPAYLTDAQYEYGIKRGLAVQTGEQFKRATVDLFGVVTDAQKRWVEVRDEREQWLQRYRIYENVISLRGKDEMMKWTDAQRARLGVDELSGYQRLGLHNPYDTTSYLRYYGNDGQLRLSEVRGFYDELERQRLDAEKARQRLIDMQQEVSDSYKKVQDSYQAARAAREARATAQRTLDEAKARNERELAAKANEGKKPCFILWCGIKPEYAGATRAEALQAGRAHKARWPTCRLCVTEHLADPNRPVDEISRIPGKTILDLR